MDVKKEIAKIIEKQSKRPFIVTVDGGTAAGKSLFVEKLCVVLKKKSIKCIVIDKDDYLISRESRNPLKEEPYSTKWFKLDVLYKNLEDVCSGANVIEKPCYDHTTGKECPSETIKIDKNSVIIISGIFSLDANIVKLSDLNILIKVNIRERLRRAIQRNKEEWGVSEEKTRKNFKEIFEPTYMKHMEKARKWADIIIDNSDWKKQKIVFIRPKTPIKPAPALHRFL